MAIHKFKDYDLNLLVTLHVLLEERNVTRAARRLGVTQSAASRSLSRLRTQLGDELLVRSNGSMLLTPRAEAMRDPLKTMLFDVGGLLFAAEEVRPAELSRTFRIAATGYPLVPLLPALVRHLEADAPNVRVDALPVFDDLDSALVASEVDLVIGSKQPGAPGVVWSPLMSDRFVVVCRPDHPRLSTEPTLGQLLNERHVDVAPDGGAAFDVLDRALDITGRRRNVVVTVPSVFVATQLVAGSDLVAVLPRGAVASLTAPQTLLCHEPPIDLPGIGVHIGWHERVRHDAAHAWFRGVLADVASTLAGDQTPPT